MTRLLDYSFARPAAAHIKASGAVGVMRYLTHSTSGKQLSGAEAKQLRAAGLQVGVVFEDTARRAADGRAAGKADALFAAAQAKTVGVPASCPIFFAVDYDASPVDILPYFQGIADAKIGHPIGVYGSLRVVEDVLLHSLATYAWQTTAWSGKDTQGKPRVSAKAHLYQRNTPSPVPGTDDNELLKPIPLWGAPAAPAKAAPKPPAKAAKSAPGHPSPAPKPHANPPAAPKSPSGESKPTPTAAQCGGLSPAQVRRLRSHRRWWLVILRWLGARR
jgi:hypothetical protein